MSKEVNWMLHQESQVETPNGRLQAARRAGRLLTTAKRALVPAFMLGALFWLAPGESQARERCTTKPIVCARLETLRAQRASTPPRPAPDRTVQHAQVARNDARCTTKPNVCARMRAMGTKPALPPVTLANSSDPGQRCTSKPMVCARLKFRSQATPMTLANAQNLP
jgi:hypothetical protein